MLLTKLLSQSKVLFIPFTMVPVFCTLNTSLLKFKNGWWLCQWVVQKHWCPPGVSSCHSLLLPAPNLKVGLFWIPSLSDMGPACIQGAFM